MRRLRHFGAAAIAVLFLNLLLTLQNIWPTPWVRPTAELSVEVAVIVLLLAAAIEWRGVLSTRLRWCLILVTLALVAGRYADITAPALFGRRIDLFWDAPHLPRVAAMVAESMPAWHLALYTCGLLLLTAAIVFGVMRSIDALSLAAARNGFRRGLAGLAVCAIGVYGIGIASTRVTTERWFALPVTPVYAQQAAFLSKATRTDETAAKPLARSNLKALRGADAFLLFLESYGAGVFETPRMQRALQAEFAALEAFADSSGWYTASAFIDSSTFGGASWLAHSTTLSGRWIAREADYRMFLAKPTETLVDRFRDAGYRTVALLPGIKLDWPEGAALRFDRILDARTLDYRGPAFGWWTIPDQFSLEALYQREMARPDRKPLFVQFASIMSHMPFGPTPPYQPDWSRMTTPRPYDPPSLDAALQLKPDWNDITAGYLRTIKYDLQLIKGFLEKRVPENALVIVSGDHQPPAIVSGKNASWSVPVHIFSRDSTIVDRFRTAGFRRGLRPARPTLARMDDFNRIILEALDTGPGLASR